MSGTTHVYPSEVEFLCKEVITFHLEKLQFQGPIRRWWTVMGTLYVEFANRQERTIQGTSNLMYWYKRIMKKLTGLKELEIRNDSESRSSGN